MDEKRTDKRLINMIHRIFNLKKIAPKAFDAILPVNEIHYADDIVNAMTEVELALHGITDSKVIGEKVMKTICDFYQAQYVGIMELDIDMDAWFPSWCIDSDGISVSYMLTQPDYVLRIPTWYEAYQKNDVIVLENISGMKNLPSEEMTFYNALQAEAFLGCPFYKRSKGFVVVMNPKRHLEQTALLRLLTYVLMMELNEHKMMKSLAAKAKAYDIFDSNEVRIDLFNGLKVKTISGLATTEDFSRDVVELLLWMAMNPTKVYYAAELEEKIWDEYGNGDGQKVRRAVAKLRNHPINLSGYPLMVNLPNGYGFNPELKITSDVYEFEKMKKMLDQITDPGIERKMLEDMAFLYKGRIQQQYRDLPWLDMMRHHCEADYLKVINKLLDVYYHECSFDQLQRWANHSMELIPNNTIAYYWKILAYKKVGMMEYAVKLQETAEKCLEKDVYRGLEERLSGQ